MHFLATLLALCASSAVVLANPIPAAEPQNGTINKILCPITGTPTCNLQCELLKQIGGQCSPQGQCFCFDGTQIGL